MSIDFFCSSCATPLRVYDHAAGSLMDCPVCKSETTVPSRRKPAVHRATPPPPLSPKVPQVALSDTALVYQTILKDAREYWETLLSAAIRPLLGKLAKYRLPSLLRDPIVLAAVGINAVILTAFLGYIASRNHWGAAPAQPLAIVDLKALEERNLKLLSAQNPVEADEPQTLVSADDEPEEAKVDPSEPDSPALASVPKSRGQAEPPNEPEVQSRSDASNEQQSVTVYVTSSGSKYHASGCRYLAKSSIPATLESVSPAYSPCSVCGPPTASSSKTRVASTGSSKTAAQMLSAAVSPDRPPATSSSVGTTPTGIPLHVGPRGGIYHYSKNGNKVYQRKKK